MQHLEYPHSGEQASVFRDTAVNRATVHSPDEMGNDPGGLWRKYDAMSLATPQAFRSNPSRSWVRCGLYMYSALNDPSPDEHCVPADDAMPPRDFSGLLRVPAAKVSDATVFCGAILESDSR